MVGGWTEMITVTIIGGQTGTITATIIGGQTGNDPELPESGLGTNWMKK